MVRFFTFALVLTLAASSCDTFRGLDTVEDPGSTGAPDVSADMAGDADTVQPPGDVGSFDAGGDLGVGDGGRLQDVGADMDLPPPSGCPRDRSQPLPWQGLRPLSPKSAALELPTDAEVQPAVSLAAVPEGDPDIGMFALAAAFSAPTFSAARIILFDAPADISDRDDYVLADITFPNVEFEYVAVRGDMTDPRFAFAAVGGETGCTVDNFELRTGYIRRSASGLATTIEETSTPLVPCDSADGHVDIAGPFGPTGHVAVFRGAGGAARHSGVGADTLLTGPSLGDWSNSIAASRRELVLAPASTSERWLAWFPNGGDTAELDLSTQGAVSVDWLFEDCHAVAGPNSTSVAVSSVDCAGAVCSVGQTQAILDALEVGLVDVAAMPDGGFVVAYAAGADEGDERVFLRFFDDAFAPVALGDDFAHQIAGTGAYVEGLSVAVTTEGSAVVVGAAFARSATDGGDVDSVHFASLRLEVP